MYKKLFGTALLTASTATLISGCGILETVEVPQIRFDSNSYIVQPGDTLQSVSSRYMIDPDSLVTVNSLELAKLIPGQRLMLLRDEEVVSMAALANKSRNANTGIQGEGVVASGVGQTVVVPNATQSVNVDPTLINTDIIAVPQGKEDVIKIVEAGSESNDVLLDDQAVFAPESVSGSTVASVERPEGVETIVREVNVNDQIAMPTAGSVNLDVGADAEPKRITVNQRLAGWNWPAIGEITKDFDLREINRQGLGIDPGPGAGIQAAADGEVVYSGRDLASYGNLVILRHADNYLSAYSKVSDIFVKENQQVKAGDLIASVGAEKTELHFEIRRNGEPVDPIDYLPAL